MSLKLLIQIKYKQDENYLFNIFKEMVYINTALFICIYFLIKNNSNIIFFNL